MHPPLFRASWTKSAIQGVNALPDEQRVRVRRAIGDARLATVRAATLVTWLPIEVHLDVAAAIESQLGTAQAQQFWKRQLEHALGTGTLRQFVEGALRLFDRSPYGFMRASPIAYKLLSRDAGIHEVTQPEPGVAVVAFREVPHAMCSSGFYALCHGQCLAALEQSDTYGEIEEDVIGARDAFRFVVRYGAALAR